MEEKSFGIIPLRKWENGWEMLLIQHRAGHWAFPKGHGEKGEGPRDTAIRELYEEVGLHVYSFFPGESFRESYEFEREGKRVKKEVEYFPALVEGEIKLQEAEISEAKWVELKEAVGVCTFKEAKRLCEELASWLS